MINTVKWSPLNASDETIPFFPNQLVKLGHHIKDKQLRRPTSDKMVHKDSYASVSLFQESVNSVIKREQTSVFQSSN